MNQKQKRSYYGTLKNYTINVSQIREFVFSLYQKCSVTKAESRPLNILFSEVDCFRYFVLFHMKARISLQYFVQDCRLVMVQNIVPLGKCTCLILNYPFTFLRNDWK